MVRRAGGVGGAEPARIGEAEVEAASKKGRAKAEDVASARA